MLDVRQLALLRAVAEHGSMSAAANVLCYTPSAASQQLRQLEGGLGLKLVERGARGARLTSEGLALLTHAQAILGRLDVAQAEMHAIAAARAGQLRLAVFPTAGAALMPTAIAAFTSAHPDVELHVTEAETSIALPALDRRDVDLVIGYDFAAAPESGPDIVRTPLLDDPMHVVLPGRHRLARSTRIRLRALAREPWISSRPHQPCARALTSACAAAGFAPNVIYESDDYVTAQALVATGAGVSMIPDLALGSPHPEIAVRSTSPDLPPRQVFSATAPHATAAAAAMTEILVSLSDNRLSQGPQSSG
jgi:DNA-binding transcriptional LysR family regulator